MKMDSWNLAVGCKRLWSLIFLSIMICAALGCATSIPEGLNQVRTGMDKDEVLRKIGNPKRTFRLEGRDHWTYIYFSNNDEWRRDVIFENGKVVKVTRPVNKANWMKEIEGASTFEEYEQLARAHQLRSSRFKTLEP